MIQYNLSIMGKCNKGRNDIVMSRDEVRAFDAWAINALGIAGVVLMENAGRSCAELIMKKLSGSSSSKVCIFCGTGNNGGDGFVIARHLHNDSFPVKVVICGRPEKIKGDARANLDLWLGLKQKIENLDFTEDITEQVNKFCNGTDLIVDAIFGTGLSGELKDGYKELVEAINKQDIPVVAVDIPSGLDCDTGRPLGAAIKAESTVTFAAMKKGFAENPQSLEYTGEVFVASIGVEPTAISI